jgi:integrase
MIYKRGRFYTVKFKHHGRVIVRSTRAMKAKDARAIESKIKSELALGHWNILELKPVPSLREFVTKHFLPFIESKVQPKTVKYYAYGCKLLLGSDLANLRLDVITDEHAARFAAHYSHLSVATINAALRTLRRCIYLAVDWKRMDRKPKLSLTKGEKRRERILVPQEIDLYLSNCLQPWKDVATIMLNTGLRPDEVFTLRREQANFEGRGTISITEGKSQAARRTLPMTPEVRRVLTERSGLPGEWLFPSASKSGHYNQGSAKRHHALALQRCGLKPFPPYILRHTALTFFGKFLDPFTLARVAGHSSITMTDRYVHPQADAIQKGFDRVTEAGYMHNALPEPSENRNDK